MDIIKNKKELLKKFSLLTAFILLIGLINIQGFTIKANAASEPQFTVTIDSYTPTNPKVGEDIIIKGTIHPQDFEIPIPAKEIVLVLDSSGSMADNNKMKNLKAAAYKFIDKMSKVENLKIAIVDFDTQATIKNQLISSKNIHALKTSIDNLAAEGGTNTGEGLRQAAYLLSNGSGQSNTASKTIVFMSDGEPTYYNWKTVEGNYIYGNYNGQYYSCYSYYNFGNRFMGNYDIPPNNYYYDGPYYGNYTGYKYQKPYNDYYTDITKSDFDSNVSLGGDGTKDSDTNSYCLNYAKTIGKIIKDKGYSAFSIGYGLDYSGNEKMKQIHDSMSATSSNFFVSDTGSIDSVFNAIGNTIISSYPITNVNFNFNSSGDTSIESIDGNTIKLPNFSYKKASETSTTVTYRADAVPFTIKIKSNIFGNHIPVFTDSTITFPWGSTTISAHVPVYSIDIKDNKLPNIQATLESVTPNPANSSQEITVKYKIDTEDFDYSIYTSQELTIKDAKLNFDLGENFDAVDDSVLKGTGKTRTVTIPEIKYTYNSTTCSWKQTQLLDITFKVKAANGKYGESLGFGSANNNTISYTNFTGTSKNSLIGTPTITINGVTDVQHGVYNCIVDGKPSIDITERTFAMGSVVPMAAFIDGFTNGNTVILAIAHGIDIIGDIKVYKVDDSGIATPSIGVMEFKNGVYTINHLSDTGGKILIVYNEKLPENISTNNEYINDLCVQEKHYQAKIRVGGTLPDLF